MKPGTQNLEPETSLLEVLAWLDYCLSETVSAMAAAKAAALETMRTLGPDGAPVPVDVFYEMCESTAMLITLRGRARSWRKHEA